MEVFVQIELEAEFNVGVRTVDGFVATGAPACALIEAAGGTSSGIGRTVTTGWAHGIGCLGVTINVALQAERRIALGEHLLIH